MKQLRLLPIAALACIAVSCQNAPGTLSESSTQSDSLVYYLGQMNAADYLREAERDTVMKESSSKQAYINGVKAGLSAMQEGNDTYNKGVMMGMQMANNILNFAQQTDVKLDASKYVASLSSALTADSMPNSQKAQIEFRRIMTQIDNDKKERDKKAAQETLSQEAQKDNLPKINDDIYGKVTSSTDSVAIEQGNEVAAEIKVTKLNGESVTMHVPAVGKVGNSRSYPQVVSDALETLKSGETGEYLTSAQALLGARAAQQNLDPKDILKVTIKASLIPQEEDKDKK